MRSMRYYIVKVRLYIAIKYWIAYNMLNKEVDTIAYTYPFPAQ